MVSESHIVALSGGKDSTAMALRLAEVEPRDYTYVCTPTGDELPEMIDHWLALGTQLGKKILPVTGVDSLKSLIRKWSALPNNRQRWCTRVLKIEPFYRWLAQNKPCVSYVGLRADEGTRQGMVFQDGDGISIRFPMREWGWTEADVWNYLDERGIKIPARTDCARCYHQTLGEWWRLWHDNAEIYASAEAEEIMTGHTFRNETRDTWPASLAALRAQFEKGRVPVNTVTTDDFFVGGRRKTHCRVCSL